MGTTILYVLLTLAGITLFGVFVVWLLMLWINKEDKKPNKGYSPEELDGL